MRKCRERQAPTASCSTSRPCPTSSSGAGLGFDGLATMRGRAEQMFASAARKSTGSRVPVARTAPRGRDLDRCCARATSSRSGRLGEPWTAPEAELDPALLRRASRNSRPTLVSWNGGGLRPAGAALPDAAARHRRADATGTAGERDRRLPLEQLPQPLSRAAPGPHGRAVRLPGARRARASSTRRCCSACRASSA